MGENQSAAELAYLPPNNTNQRTSDREASKKRAANARRMSTTDVTVKTSRAEKGKDVFLINFTQFYELLLKIVQIVYADLYQEDPTVAMNKLLQVMHCWAVEFEDFISNEIGIYIAALCLDSRPL